MGLALALAPAYVLRFHVGPLPSTVLEVVLLVAIVTGLLAFRGELPWRSPYSRPALLLLVAATLTAWFTVSPHSKSLGIWKAYFIEPALAGLVIAAIARHRDRATILLAGLGAGGAVAALLNIAAVLRAVATHQFSVVTPPVAIYLTANAVPLFLGPPAAIALALGLFGDRAWERRAGLGLFALFALAIVLSFSRAGWLALVASGVAIAWFHPWRWRILGAAAALSLAAFALVPAIRRRVLVEFDLSSPANTIQLRLVLWRSTLDMLRHRPVLGGGLNGFKQAVAPFAHPGYHEDLIYPHNLVLNFWTETGLLGVAAMGWLLVQAARVTARGLRGSAFTRAYAVGMVGALVAIVVHGLFDVPYFKNDQALVLWALLGIQLASVTLRDGG